MVHAKEASLFLEADAGDLISGRDNRPAPEVRYQQFAQAAPPPADSAPSVTAASIGVVSALQGSASVTRDRKTTPLKLQDEIFKSDTVKTAAGATLGITFDDETSLNLTPNASIVVDDFVYQDGGKNNAATFRFVKGTVAFAASAVAKTGSMTMATPTSNLGIRGTTGLVEVGQAASADSTTASANDAIKLYPDADGKVGRIEVTGRDGTPLGVLSRGATGLSVGHGGPGSRVVATPLQISPQQAARDQGIVRQVHAVQQAGRGIVAKRNIVRQRTLPHQPGVAPHTPAGSHPPGAAIPHQPGAVPHAPNQFKPSPAAPKPPALRQPPRRPAPAPKGKKH
jgi:hypothetical protein